jgi:hypothetical protein
MTAISACKPSATSALTGVDVANAVSPTEKSELLAGAAVRLTAMLQSDQLLNPDARILIGHKPSSGTLLGEYCECYQGLVTGDQNRFARYFWEVVPDESRWSPLRAACDDGTGYSGVEQVLLWERGEGSLHEYARLTRDQLHDMHESGQRAWRRFGVAVNRMRNLRTSLYYGEHYENCVAVIVPRDSDLLPAVWAFCSSEEFPLSVRAIDQKVSLTNATLVKVPFDLARWQAVAAERFPLGVPVPQSDDPTQWRFGGEIASSIAPLQVAVGRLVGCRWPGQDDDGDHSADSSYGDAIVCITPIKGEASAADRIVGLLAAAFGPDWSAGKLDALMRGAGHAGESLDSWLRDDFFEDHCSQFLQHPFIWHIWDGRRDGFHALINYHKLIAKDGEGRRTLEKLIYSYLGDWIERQRAEQSNGIDGADARVAAAIHLKSELEKILHGEPPYDIFVRWKPLHDQPIGWEPDINDGMRLNIRPFMMAHPLGAKAKGACILRVTPRGIKWDKDRGKEPERNKEEYPWFWGWDESTPDFAGGKSFDGNRWNGLHYSTASKQKARDKAKPASEKRPVATARETK